MAIFSKILTMLRGDLREMGQSVVDQNATTIYEQEIVEAKAHVAKAKQDLTALMAKQMQSAREIERLQQEIASYEDKALQALQKNEAGLAEEVANKIANLETSLAEEHAAHQAFDGQLQRLKALIVNAEGSLRDHERQLAMAKTTESVYRATSMIEESMGSSGSKLLNAKESMERIKQRQQDHADRMQAREQLDSELGDRALDAKLAAAGIGELQDRKAQVMARLKAKAAPSAAVAVEAAPAATDPVKAD